MRLSWNEVRARAARFAEEWKDATYEKGETQSFYNDFFHVFGVKRRSVARYEQYVEKLNNKHGFIDLFWRGVLLVEQKSAGRDLSGAREQALEYFDAIPEKDRPRYILLCDFQNFELLDLDEREETCFPLSNLPNNVEKFGFILGVQRRSFRDQDPANVEASELVGRLHDKLAASGYRGHDLERFLVRIVFCLFADDTGIFEPRDIFLEFVESRTKQDGTDLGALLSQLFQVLNTPEDARPALLDEDLARFPYVNGDLFEQHLLIPAFDAEMRETLLECCHFDWSEISPAIFGALFQSVLGGKERRATGAHYTTEKNILKVIQPLFMDDLREEFEGLRSRVLGRTAALKRFQSKLGELKFLDPACGCGNFLIIAYRELRRLELDVLKEIHAAQHDVGGRAIDVGTFLSIVNVDQFYGIEISEFPVRIAETAMWMMDHIMNVQLSLELGEPFLRIPLQASPTIRCADALECDWAELLPPEECSYVFGNPPFIGAKYQSDFQRSQVRRIAELGGSGGTLDYVAAWFIRAGAYIDGNARIGLVATNSITQGELVGQLWPLLFDRFELAIAFAHRTFAWGSDARGKAHVHVVIVGLDKRPNERRRKLLFDYPDIDGDPVETRHRSLLPYLAGAERIANPNLTVMTEREPINGFRRMVIGSKPIDGGHFILDSKERCELLDSEPDAAEFVRPFVGANEFLKNRKRWIIALQEASPELIDRMPKIKQRIASVREFRMGSKSAPTRKLAETPTLFHVNVIPRHPFLVIPEVSSERREYVPIGWLEPPAIPSNLVRILENAQYFEFALLMSAMHMVWLRNVGGRMKSDYRYSIGLVYNTFPTPPRYPDCMRGRRFEILVQSVLEARNEFPEASLATLYDPDSMPVGLKRAHQALDRAIDKLYRRSGFETDRERFEHLFSLYEVMKAPVVSEARPGIRRARRK